MRNVDYLDTEFNEIPAFCASYVIFHFSGDEPEDSDEYEEPIPYKQLMEEFKVHENHAVTMNKAILVVCINEHQEEAERALVDSGFTNTGWVHRPKKHINQVSMWYKIIGEKV